MFEYIWHNYAVDIFIDLFPENGRNITYTNQKKHYIILTHKKSNFYKKNY